PVDERCSAPETAPVPQLARSKRARLRLSPACADETARLMSWECLEKQCEQRRRALTTRGRIRLDVVPFVVGRTRIHASLEIQQAHVSKIDGVSFRLQ